MENIQSSKNTPSISARHIPLSEACVGTNYKIIALMAGKGLDERLATLGLHINSELCILQIRFGGAMVVARGDTRIALGAGLTAKIMVCEIVPPSH